jgi:asparaginyl-tRNA synthetase
MSHEDTTSKPASADSVDVRDLSLHTGETVRLRGWVRKHRSSGKILFVILRDGTGEVQVVFAKDEVDETSWETAEALAHEASIEIDGVVREDTRAPSGYEITGRRVELIGPSPEFPIQPKEHGTDFLLQNRHLWLRSPRQAAIMRVRDEVVRAIRDFFHEQGFVLVDTPILTGAIGESAGTLFETEYFDLGKAYLAQTGQLYLEAAAAVLGKVYCFGPTFRAEKSKTRRHLAEFWMVEPEVAWLDSEGNMGLHACWSTGGRISRFWRGRSRTWRRSVHPSTESATRRRSSISRRGGARLSGARTWARKTRRRSPRGARCPSSSTIIRSVPRRST